MTRAAREGDKPALLALWREAFGDADGDVAAFFDCWYAPERTAVAERDGALAAAGYLLPVGALVPPDGHRTPCAMIYGVAAFTAHRGHGCGARVTAELAANARALGFPVTVLRPAEDSLFAFYSGKTDFQTCFYALEETYAAAPAQKNGVTLAPAPPEAYREAREARLQGLRHIDMDARALAYQARVCGETGGLFLLKRGGETLGCAVAERRDGCAAVKELLAPDGARGGALAAIADALSAERCLVRRPGAAKDGARRFGMAVGAAPCPPDGVAWDGLAFD
jgi:hypothetical protein